MYKETKAIFDELDIDIDPRDKVATLSVSQMQMIEIAKAFLTMQKSSLWMSQPLH